MAYWLLKSEPGTWSWDDQLKKGDEGEGWDGVRNYQASNNMKKMEIGDLAFFYHSVNEKSIVGIVSIIEKYQDDPTDKTGRFGMVVVKAIKSFTKSVSLSEIKSNQKLQGISLIKQSRLSVMPITKEHWDIILEMGETSI
jgi:predicted RNA-binding protein with PUA-like domain|tara:strand:+ start:549 stop:968 length:420 start_codon:yes stop_codon:yes gene_type:complete